MEKNRLIYDAECNLCHRFSTFIKKHSKNIGFIPMQTDEGKEMLKQNNLSANNPGTLLYVEDGKTYTKSMAILSIIKKLNGIWKIFYVIAILPGFYRNKLYDIISKNRYKWFGKTNAKKNLIINILNIWHLKTKNANLVRAAHLR